MSALTCNFCGRISTKIDGWRQIFTRSIQTHDDEQNYMICPKCHKLLIEDKLGAVVDPELEMDAIRDSLEDDDPTRPYIGMSLREFLCSGMYLKTQNIFFQDKLGMDIKDYMPCMDARVLGINAPDEKGRRKVTLDYDPE